MMTKEDRAILSEIQSLLKTDPQSEEPLDESEFTLFRTHHAIIVPAGRRAAYSVDESGNVIGIKFGSPPRPHVVINCVARLQHLERLVFASEEKIEIPVSISRLNRLKFVWLGGKISKLPSELLR